MEMACFAKDGITSLQIFFFPLSSGQGRESVYLLVPSSESNPGEATEEKGLTGWSCREEVIGFPPPGTGWGQRVLEATEGRQFQGKFPNRATHDTITAKEAEAPT